MILVVQNSYSTVAVNLATLDPSVLPYPNVGQQPRLPRSFPVLQCHNYSKQIQSSLSIVCIRVYCTARQGLEFLQYESGEKGAGRTVSPRSDSFRSQGRTSYIEESR